MTTCTTYKITARENTHWTFGLKPCSIYSIALWRLAPVSLTYMKYSCMNFSFFSVRFIQVLVNRWVYWDRLTRVWLSYSWFDFWNVHETLYEHVTDSTASVSRCPIKDCRLFSLSSLSFLASFVFDSLIKVSAFPQQQMCGTELCIAAKGYIPVMPLFYKNKSHKSIILTAAVLTWAPFKSCHSTSNFQSTSFQR